MSLPDFRILARYVAVAAIGVLAAAQNSSAADQQVIPGAPHLLPEDTLAYIRIDDFDEMREGAAGSSLGRMLTLRALLVITNSISVIRYMGI